MRIRSTTTSLITLLATFLLALALVAPAAAASDESAEGKDKAGERNALAVHHGSVTAVLTTADSDGHQLGDLRVVSVATVTEAGEPLGRLDATLTTTAVDSPGAGDEIRISTLVFSFGEAGDDQVVVGGSAVYPAQGSTLATGTTTTRPILGGSGRFSGATGNAVSEHFDDDTWVHWLKFDKGKAVKIKSDKDKDKADKEADKLEWLDDQAIRDRLRATIRERRAELKERRAELRENRSRTRNEAPDSRVTEEVGITRTDLGIAEPGSAPGEVLGLWQYSIPAGSELDPHTHPGWQIARIARGELEYTVISGEGTLIHEDGSSKPIGPGTYTLKTGDSVVENPDLEHFGANRTRRPVIILAATLYPAGAPLSSPLETPATETSPAP